MVIYFAFGSSVVRGSPADTSPKHCLKRDFEPDEWVDPNSQKFLDLFQSSLNPTERKSGRPRIELWSLANVAESPGFNPAACLPNIEASLEQASGPKVKIELKNGFPFIRGPSVAKPTNYSFSGKLKNASGEKSLVINLLIVP